VGGAERNSPEIAYSQGSVSKERGGPGEPKKTVCSAENRRRKKRGPTGLAVVACRKKGDGPPEMGGGGGGGERDCSFSLGEDGGGGKRNNSIDHHAFEGNAGSKISRRSRISPGNERLQPSDKASGPGGRPDGGVLPKAGVLLSFPLYPKEKRKRPIYLSRNKSCVREKGGKGKRNRGRVPRIL